MKFRHRQAYRLSIISLIVTVSRLSFVSVYSTICTKSIVIAYKIYYKRPLYFGLPGVYWNIEASGSSLICLSGKLRIVAHKYRTLSGILRI